jgi:hypothetical protein
MPFLRVFLVVLATSGLLGCAQASAATPDPSQDLDCSVVAFYFNGLAKHKGAAADQHHALSTVNKWYATRLQAIAKKDGVESVLARTGPLLEAVKREPMEMRDELSACTDRALSEGLRG